MQPGCRVSHTVSRVRGRDIWGFTSRTPHCAARTRTPHPTGLGPIGVSGEPGARPATVIADARLAKALVGSSCENVLRQDRFWLRLPQRWRGSGRAEVIQASIITRHGADESYAFAFYGDMVAARDREASLQLEAFRQALHDVAFEVRIEPGIMVMIDNRIAAHGRTAFQSSFTAEGALYRWVQRVVWASDLTRFSSWTVRHPAVFAPPSASLLGQVAINVPR